jgi:hypothetical protein
MRFTILAEEQPSVVAVFERHTGAEHAIEQLQDGGFDIGQLSIIGRDLYSDEHVFGCYTISRRIKYWGKLGDFWDGVWGLLTGAAFLIIPGVGPVLVAGHIASWIIGTIEAATVIGGLSALGSALVSFGIPKCSASNYEHCIKLGKYIFIVHGTADELDRAREILQSCAAEIVNMHLVPRQTTATAAAAFTA